jgi:hypothetical protein
MLQINEEASMIYEGGNDGERRMSNPDQEPARDSSQMLARQRTSEFSKRYLRAGTSGQGALEIKNQNQYTLDSFEEAANRNSQRSEGREDLNQVQ